MIGIARIYLSRALRQCDQMIRRNKSIFVCNCILRFIVIDEYRKGFRSLIIKIATDILSSQVLFPVQKTAYVFGGIGFPVPVEVKPLTVVFIQLFFYLPVTAVAATDIFYVVHFLYMSFYSFGTNPYKRCHLFR